MADFLAMLQTFLTSFLAMMGDVVTFIWEHPLILVVVMIAIIGIVIKIVRRFLPGRP